MRPRSSTIRKSRNRLRRAARRAALLFLRYWANGGGAAFREDGAAGRKAPARHGGFLRREKARARARPARDRYFVRRRAGRKRFWGRTAALLRAGLRRAATRAGLAPECRGFRIAAGAHTAARPSDCRLNPAAMAGRADGAWPRAGSAGPVRLLERPETPAAKQRANPACGLDGSARNPSTGHTGGAPRAY